MIKTYKEYLEGVKTTPSKIIKKQQIKSIKKNIEKQNVEYILRHPEITTEGYCTPHYKVLIDGKLQILDLINGFVKTTNKKVKDQLLEAEFLLVKEKKI